MASCLAGVKFSQIGGVYFDGNNRCKVRKSAWFKFYHRRTRWLIVIPIVEVFVVSRDRLWPNLPSKSIFAIPNSKSLGHSKTWIKTECNSLQTTVFRQCFFTKVEDAPFIPSSVTKEPVQLWKKSKVFNFQTFPVFCCPLSQLVCTWCQRQYAVFKSGRPGLCWAWISQDGACFLMAHVALPSCQVLVFSQCLGWTRFGCGLIYLPRVSLIIRCPCSWVPFRIGFFFV